MSELSYDIGIKKVVITNGDAKGKETLSVSGTAVSLASIPPGAIKAFVTSETVDVRYWVTGDTPTTAQGHLVLAGNAIELDSAGQLVNFKVIATSGTATLQITYF